MKLASNHGSSRPLSLAFAGLENDYGVMARLLCALSDYTSIKELHVREFGLSFDDPEKWQFTRPLLEWMLKSLSGPTSQAFFPSLQILKFTLSSYGDDDYSKLKTIMLGDEKI